MSQLVRRLTTRLTVAATLKQTLELLRTSRYQQRFFAMNDRGKSCSPLVKDAALSMRGAIIRASDGVGGAAAAFDFMKLNRLLPRREPTREEAIRLVTQALELAERREAAKLQEDRERASTDIWERAE